MGIKEKVKSKLLEGQARKTEEAAKKIIASDLQRMEEETKQIKEELSKVKCNKCGNLLDEKTIDSIMEVITEEADVDEEYEKMKEIAKEE